MKSATLSLVCLMLVLTSCTTDPLRRSASAFPPPVPKPTPEGIHITRRGFVEKRQSIMWTFNY